MIIAEIRHHLETLYKDKPNRHKHVLGVCETARKLGEIHGADIQKLELAALLHDITKYYSSEKNIKIIKENYENADEILSEFNIHILHAFSAKVIAKKEYGIHDEDVLSAIENHTIGKANMNIYEKIIFISDYVEPNRTYPSCVKARGLVFENIDLAVYTAIHDSIVFYENSGGHVPKSAYTAREFYHNLLGGKV